MVISKQSTSDLRNEVGAFLEGFPSICARCSIPLPIAEDIGTPNNDPPEELAIALCDDCWHWLLMVLIGPNLGRMIDEAAPNRTTLLCGVCKALQSKAKASLDLFWSTSQAPARSKAERRLEVFDSIPLQIDYWRRVREARKDYEKDVSERYGHSVSYLVKDTPDDQALESSKRSEARIDIAKLEANAHLSAREAKVLAMLKENEDPSDIAKKLHISVRNVHTIESRLRAKLRRACGP